MSFWDIFKKSDNTVVNNTIPSLLEASVKNQEYLAQINTTMADLANFQYKPGALPIAVQSFPLVDDLKYEHEKQNLAAMAYPYFSKYEATFSEKLKSTANNVLTHHRNFYQYLLNVRSNESTSVQKYKDSFQRALAELLACSPKKIMAELNKSSLEAGWAYVEGYNAIIDKFAQQFPRCRAGIYQFRLKYSDVIQISDEILTTLRPCQIIMEDLQRRYDTLEALQNCIQADLDYTECEKIIAAAKKTFTDNKEYGNNSGILKKIVSFTMQPLTAMGDAMAIPSLQIQGQMERENRLIVFFSTADMLQECWTEWCSVNEQIVEPHLKIMFDLKRDFFKNQIICICDILSYNGYSLEGVSEQFNKFFL